jgi:hypothetical protein
MLPPMVENFIELDRGQAATQVEALRAATAALLPVVACAGRHEYQLTIDRGLTMMIVPGLTEDGQVALEVLADSLDQDARELTDAGRSGWRRQPVAASTAWRSGVRLLRDLSQPPYSLGMPGVSAALRT